MTIETSTTETNEQICRALIERGFNNGDLDGLDGHRRPRQSSSTRKARPPASMACVRSSPSCAPRISDLHLEIQDTATSGDKVWFRIRSTGTNDGPMWGRPATGRPIDITVMDVMRVVDGRMVEHWGVADRLAVLKQIGAMGGGGR